MQDIRQVYNCIFNPYGTVLDSAHIQHIIDQAEQMLTGYMDLFNPEQAPYCQYVLSQAQ